MRLKIKNKSQKYDINWLRLRHGPKYTKYKLYPSIMLVLCIKQQLRIIWSSIHEKVKQHWCRVEEKGVLNYLIPEAATGGVL